MSRLSGLLWLCIALCVVTASSAKTAGRREAPVDRQERRQGMKERYEAMVASLVEGGMGEEDAAKAARARVAAMAGDKGARGEALHGDERREKFETMIAKLVESGMSEEDAANAARERLAAAGGQKGDARDGERREDFEAAVARLVEGGMTEEAAQLAAKKRMALTEKYTTMVAEFVEQGMSAEDAHTAAKLELREHDHSDHDDYDRRGDHDDYDRRGDHDDYDRRGDHDDHHDHHEGVALMAVESDGDSHHRKGDDDSHHRKGDDDSHHRKGDDDSHHRKGDDEQHSGHRRGDDDDHDGHRPRLAHIAIGVSSLALAGVCFILCKLYCKYRCCGSAALQDPEAPAAPPAEFRKEPVALPTVVKNPSGGLQIGEVDAPAAIYTTTVAYAAPAVAEKPGTPTDAKSAVPVMV